MTNNDFLKGYEDVMGCPLTWPNVLAALVVIICLFLVLWIGSVINL